MRKKILCLLFLAVFFLPFQSVMASTTTTNILHSETTLNLQTLANYNDNLTQSQTSLNTPEQPLLNPSDPWSDLRMWIDEGLKGLDESTESLMMLERQLLELRAETREQELLLEQSQILLMSLRQSLDEALWAIDVAIDRMEDAEAYAWWIDAQNELLRQQVQQFRMSASIGFAVGGVSFGFGTPLVTYGLINDNKVMTGVGIGVSVIPSSVWALGHYLFKWW